MTPEEELAKIHRPVTNPMYQRPICEDDGQEWPCKTAIVARLALADPILSALQRNDMGRVIALALSSQGYAQTDSEAVGLALLREIEEGGYTLRLTTSAERRARRG